MRNREKSVDEGTKLEGYIVLQFHLVGEVQGKVFDGFILQIRAKMMREVIF